LLIYTFNISERPINRESVAVKLPQLTIVYN